MSETSTIVTPLINALNGIPEVFAYRVHSGKVKVRNGWMKLADAGFPDIACVVRGVACFFEAKKRRTKGASLVFEPGQLSVHDDLRRCGARVVVIESVAEAIAVVREILASTTGAVTREPVSIEAARSPRVSRSAAGLPSGGGTLKSEGPAVAAASPSVSRPSRPTKDRKGVPRAGQ